MRTYGRLLKNIAAIALLLALLLPFCKFSAGGQEMTLSGLDVVKAGGKAGYTYLTEGRVADTFVLKAPITVGTVKSSLSYVQGVGQMRLLAVCAIAALLPVLLCFLSVGMLFLAEGKKTMLLPTLFTSLVLAELLQSRPNFLVLDEPTNHMDIQAKGSCTNCCQIFIAYDPYLFGSKDEIQDMLNRRIDAVKKAHPEREGGSVSYPGERTLAVREESMKKGIHVDEAIWKQLCSLASGDMSTTDIASK